jgi:prepilin-type N-terminal cleavage/methylation domain-containing protein
MSRRARGITLIELIVVMAIVSVMLAFVGPSISAGMDNLVLQSSARRVASAFRIASAAARTKGGRIFAANDDNSISFTNGSSPFQTITMPRGIRFSTSGPATTFVLLESGQILGPDRLDLVNSRGRHVQLSIDHATGLIRLVDRT